MNISSFRVGSMRSLFVLALAAVAVAGAAAPARADVKKNIDTYWHYRDRLITKYLVLGEGQGLSLPASDRWRYKKTGEQEMAIEWADCTTFHGWYIATLATEHYMLSRPGIFPNYARGRARAKEDVENEIYLALRALGRLDRVAESSFDKGHRDHPGFFIRDDVLRDDEHRPPEDIRSLFPGRPYGWLGSDFMAQDNRDKEMSQDQVIHLLFGLSFVYQLIPGHLVVNGMRVRQEATRLAVPMVEIMTTRRFESCASGSSCSPWVIRNPVTKKAVKRGANAGRMAPGINKAINFLTDDRVNFGSFISEWGWARWYNFRLFMYFMNPDNLHMGMALAAISNGWDRHGDRSTMKELMSYAKGHRWYLYPLANAVLQPKVVSQLPYWGDYQKNLVQHVSQMLDSAPWDGPHQPLDCVLSRVGGEDVWNCSHTHKGWSSTHRFLRKLSEQDHGIEHFRGTERWFNGLDYMLLHNLYYIAISQMWADPGSEPEHGNGAAADAAAGDADAAAGDAAADAAADDGAADAAADDGAAGAADDGATDSAADCDETGHPDHLCPDALGADAECEPGDVGLVDDICADGAFAEVCAFCDRLCGLVLPCVPSEQVPPAPDADEQTLLRSCNYDCLDMNVDQINDESLQTAACVESAADDCRATKECFLTEDLAGLEEGSDYSGTGCRSGGGGRPSTAGFLLLVLLLLRGRGCRTRGFRLSSRDVLDRGEGTEPCRRPSASTG